MGRGSPTAETGAENISAADSEIDPAIAYAVNKTGRIVTETNAQFLTDTELQEWHDAVDEYHQRMESGETQ